MWRAQFSNGNILEKFDKNGQEVLFKKVLDRLDDLENLSVILGNKTYTVRMSDGRFSICITDTESLRTESHFFALDVDVIDLKHIRPIYFVRETVNLSTQGKIPTVLGPSRINFIAVGFQASFKGHNVKRYLAIFPDGTFVVKDK